MKLKKLHMKPSSLGATSSTMKHPLTKRARRLAKKNFPKTKRTPGGLHELYSISTEINTAPVLPPHTIAWLQSIEDEALKMFKKPYKRLSSSDKTRVFESLSEQLKKEKHGVA